MNVVTEDSQLVLPAEVLVTEALRAGGMDKDGIERGQRALAWLSEKFLATAPPAAPLARARQLFRWLWERKPHRYAPGASWRLDLVLAHEFDPKVDVVGNCLGLTVLYNCLLRRLGIPVRTLFVAHAFERGPHVLSLLETAHDELDVENIHPQGFGYAGHRGRDDRELWDDGGLIADLYLSRGNDAFAAGDIPHALAMYELTCQWHPQSERAALNLAIARDALGATAAQESR